MVNMFWKFNGVFALKLTLTSASLFSFVSLFSLERCEVILLENFGITSRSNTIFDGFFILK